MRSRMFCLYALLIYVTQLIHGITKGVKDLFEHKNINKEKKIKEGFLKLNMGLN